VVGLLSAAIVTSNFAAFTQLNLDGPPSLCPLGDHSL